MYPSIAPRSSFASRGLRVAALTLAVIAAAITVLPARASDAAPAAAQTPLEQATHAQANQYRVQQWRRLSAQTSRDDLIAAVLLGAQREGDAGPIAGHEVAEERLAAHYGQDPLALYALALACQVQSVPCARTDSHESLVRVAPGNAMHWLMVPNDAAPSDAQLHAASIAPMSDTHLREVIAILRKSLVGQSAPVQVEGVDARALAMTLLDDAICQVPLQRFRQVMVMCKGAVEPRRSDCLALGRLFEDDRSGSILARMIGSAMVRRAAKGTPEETAAKELRRDYVWMTDQVEKLSADEQDRIQREVVADGEWVAWQRASERVTGMRLPPADWMPKNPVTLMLSEDRPAATP